MIKFWWLRKLCKVQYSAIPQYIVFPMYTTKFCFRILLSKYVGMDLNMHKFDFVSNWLINYMY